MLWDYLTSRYAPNEPIFTEDVEIVGVNRPNLLQQLKTLSDAGKLVRYEKGVYYIPKRTRFGLETGPGSEKVATCKYVARRGKTIGYFTGATFANFLGLSLQVPMKMEITTNNIAAAVREIAVGVQKFVVRRAVVPVSEENAKILPLLDLLKNLDAYLDCDYDEARRKIQKYALDARLTQSEVERYIKKYPDSTFRFFYEMRLGHVLA